MAETQDSLGQSSKSESFTNEGDENLPTYDEVVIEHNYQDIVNIKEPKKISRIWYIRGREGGEGEFIYYSLYE